MAVGTPCQTSGAVFSTHITPEEISVNVSFGKIIDLDECGARLLESNIHNALELVLAPYFKEQ